MYRYTVAVCHLNMVETVEESVLSILENTTEEFEVLIVDDGSTDGSRTVLDQLAETNERVRVVYGNNENIAQARNSSIEYAAGEFVLHQLDADDRYGRGIVDFAEVFERIDASVERDVYLRGRDIHIASRDLLRRIPYRNVGYGEDLDLWRRMDADPTVEMVWVSHVPIHENIGYERNLLEYAKVRYSTAKVNFQTGISPISYVRWMVYELLPGGWTMRPWYGALFHILITPLAYADSIYDGHLNNTFLPDRYADYCWYMDHVLTSIKTLSEIEQEYGIQIDRGHLSDAGREIFFSDDFPTQEDTAP